MSTDETPLDHLASALRGRATVAGGEAPAAILWTDPKGEWRSTLPDARDLIPELLCLGWGEYDPGGRTGPAIWLRCVVDRVLKVEGVVDDVVPILYMPNVKRDQLCAGEDCPEELRPLVELMYRGVLWHQVNGRDWTALAFLRHPSGPNLDIASDQETASALRDALDRVARTKVAELQGRPLGATDFRRLSGVDVIRDVLRWMAAPDEAPERMGDRHWTAFVQECAKELRFDPSSDADVEAGGMLAEGAGRWSEVWDRYCEAPSSFHGVGDLLARSRPSDVLPLNRERWPDLNDEDEEAVRDALGNLPELSVEDAGLAVMRLDEEHGHRRDWVWARQGQSPFAQILKPLAILARWAREPAGGSDPEAIAQNYIESGWRADFAARHSLALTPPEHGSIVSGAVAHLYRDWLIESARNFQAAVERRALPTAGEQPAVVAEPGECLVFVDGLRYELGCCLVERLRNLDCEVELGIRWAALPTVTATAKPAVTPVAEAVFGETLGKDFRPNLPSGKPATAKELRDQIESEGYWVLDDSGGMPTGAGVSGWVEFGTIDKHGHAMGAVQFAAQVERELSEIATRVTSLLASGWSAVRIVSDHGWLLLPGGLPLAQLPRHLTESKWARCAAISGDSKPSVPMHPWHWNRNEWFASPLDIACFSQRPEYAHGGLSLQECLTPDIRVAGSSRPEGAAIKRISWTRMRCDIEVVVETEATVDLRLGGVSGESVASQPKTVDSEGLASLLLAADEHEEAELVVVVFDARGRILAHRATRAGEAT